MRVMVKNRDRDIPSNHCQHLLLLLIMRALILSSHISEDVTSGVLEPALELEVIYKKIVAIPYF